MKKLLTCRNLSKTFRLGEFISPKALVRRLFYNVRLKGAVSTNKHIALENINFEIFEGEKVAILGINGAGKSTLLKLIAGIMSPTSGSIEIHNNGLVLPLLGVGAGFNIELTGKENLNLLGSVYGLDRNRIKQLYVDITEFAGISRFMDTPVKRYSKGMKARLGISIALHIYPSLLIVDEVLAVGDQAFREKCMKRVEDLCSNGTSLIFVSHSASRMLRLCKRGLYLKGGKLAYDGDIKSAVDMYLNDTVTPMTNILTKDTKPIDDYYIPSRIKNKIFGNEKESPIMITSINIGDKSGAKDAFILNEDIYITISYKVFEECSAKTRIIVFDDEGSVLFQSIDNSQSYLRQAKRPGVYNSLVNLPADMLHPGIYQILISISSNQPLVKHLKIDKSVQIEIKPASPGSYPLMSQDLAIKLPGNIKPYLDWTTNKSG